MIHINQHNQIHQVNAPAMIFCDTLFWYHNGLKHRYYGPALSEFEEDELIGHYYWIFGEMIT